MGRVRRWPTGAMTGLGAGGPGADTDGSDASSTTIVRNATGPRPPLLLVPPGGGGAFSYRHLVEALGPDQPVVIVEMRGLNRPGPIDRTVPALAERLVLAVETLDRWPDPLVVVGFSSGGPVAYEAAARLQDRGRRVRVVLIDTVPGSRIMVDAFVDFLPPRSPPRGLRERVRRSAGAALRSVPNAMAWLKVERYVWFPGPPSSATARYHAFSRLMNRASRRHRPRPPSFPVLLIHGHRRERMVTELRAFTPDVEVRALPAEHRSMLTPPTVREVARILAEIAEGGSSVD